ncbi:polycystic kidney disease protein 1-like [Homalodisca vitripennis]|nr:polycystic kidney disease protein 1-like [Homalodisca vitripennis]
MYIDRTPVKKVTYPQWGTSGMGTSPIAATFVQSSPYHSSGPTPSTGNPLAPELLFNTIGTKVFAAATGGVEQYKVNRPSKVRHASPENPSTVKTRSMSDSNILSSLSTQLESLVKEMREFREKSKKEMREFREESKARGKSIDSTHDKIDDVKVLINAQREDIGKCLDVIYVLKVENSQGVPENKSENVFEVVEAVAKVLRFDLKPEMIDAEYRLAGGSGASRPRGIILKFVRRGDCDELLRLAKVKRGFPASERDFSSENKVFVNPSLSKAFRELLYHAKCAAREGRVRFAWYSNGKVLVR